MNFYKFCRNARIQCNAFHSPRSFETPISPQNKGGERDVWPPDDPTAATCCVAVGGNPSLTSLSASAFSSKHFPQQLKYPGRTKKKIIKLNHQILLVYFYRILSNLYRQLQWL